MDLKAIVNRIERRLRATRQSAAGASTAAGLSNSAIRNLQRTSQLSGKGFNVRTIQALAPVLRTSVTWLLEERGPEEVEGPESYEINVAGLPILGIIAAGVWRETSLYFDQDGEVKMLPVARDLRFPHARQYCLEVLGDSMDLAGYPDGSFVTCVDFAESGLSLREKMTVHVERYRNGGELVEVTLKRVQILDGILSLVPQSSNPKHKPFPLPTWQDGVFVAHLEDTEVFVKGVVIGKYETVQF